MTERQRGVTYVPLSEAGEERDYTEDMGAAEVAMTNLEEEIRQTEGLSVTVNKSVGGPNKPMQHCFRQAASNFPMLDDLKEYVQKHFGEGDYRAFYRVGNKIKYNIPFSIAADYKRPADVALPAPGASSEVKELLNYLIQRDQREAEERRQERALQQAGAPKDAKAELIETIRLVKEIMPQQQAAGGGGAAGITGLREFLEMKEMMREELTAAGLKGGEEGFNWKDLFAQLPTALGALAGIAQARRGQALPAPQPEPAMTLEPPVPETLAPEIPVPNLTPQARAFAQQMEPLRPQLQQLDTAATFKSDPAFMAETVLDMAEKQNPAMLPVLAGIAAPLNREDVLAALGAVIPATAGRRDWYVSFLDAVHNALAPEEGTA